MPEAKSATDHNAFDFKALVEDFFQDFPALTETVSFIHSRTQTLYHVDKGVFCGEPLKDNPKWEFLLSSWNVASKIDLNKVSITKAFGDHSLIICNFDDAATDNALANRDEIVANCQHRFYHEVGHALIRQGVITPAADQKRFDKLKTDDLRRYVPNDVAHMNWHESVADVYAALMLRTKGLDMGKEYRDNLFSILLSYAEDYQDVMGHVTFFAVREAMSYSQEELSGKNPEDVLALAIEIADQYSLTQSDIEALYGVFKKPAKTMHQILKVAPGSDKSQNLKQQLIDDVEAIANGAAVPEIRQIAIAMMKSMHNYGFFQSQEETQDHQKRIQVAEAALRAGKSPAKRNLCDRARSLFKKKLKLSPAFKLWPEYQPQPAQIRVSPLQLKPE